MRFGSLFAGIGGMDRGLESSGMSCCWQVENDPHAVRVLEKHWPNVERFEDVRTVGKYNLRQVDLICGGFPCQDLSFAGKGAGLNGKRSGLWFEFLRIICELRPRYVIVENVPAILVRGMDTVLGGLAGIGYDAEWDCLSAREFGADHLRRRIFIVAYPNSQGRAGLESGRSPRVFGQRRRSGKAYLQLEDWRTRPLFDSGRAPLLCRREDGVSNRVHRLKRIGNAIVPQIAEWIGKQIMECELKRRTP